eukprot:CAMPEP_0176212326 /NCGR_PEP_ID=MMETSP0121_2-20121125/15097_1 /TAXON_ID=160619 /ORGANISM="Kryptoperidinium foliaceum, Strain CCMP 1326" /LENGTH=58 /DNA_ID=CAMNT_0017551377 /DNA_START=144 /DNA_END=316 /DNA_ORIENTATION=-
MRRQAGGASPSSSDCGALHVAPEAPTAGREKAAALVDNGVAPRARHCSAAQHRCKAQG